MKSINFELEEAKTRAYFGKVRIYREGWTWVYNERKEEWIEVRDYRFMPRVFRDNQNTTTNAEPYLPTFTGGSKCRIPSRKHKNKWKNFVKLFPYFKYK